MTLCKEHLVRKISSVNGCSKNKSSRLLETALEVIKSALESGEDIMISGFGKFQVKERKNRRGRIPQLKTHLDLEDRRVVTFRCSDVFKNRINSTS